MISIAQIKAGRALLSWTQADLARSTGLHLNAIYKIECGLTSPRQKTLQRIKECMERAGLNFRGMEGLEIRRDTLGIRKFEGPTFVHQFNRDVLSVLRSPDDETFGIYHDLGQYDDFDPVESDRFVREMHRIGFRQRLIIPHGYDRYLTSRSEYRSLSADEIGQVSWIVYRDYFALIAWRASEVVVINNPAVAETFKRQFESLWCKATPVVLPKSARKRPYVKRK